MPVRGQPVSRFDGPVGWDPLVGLLGLLHVQGALMSRNYGLRPGRGEIYQPPVKELSRIVVFFSLLFGATLLALLITAMMALAQFMYWIIS